MRLLLDTHVFLWYVAGDSRIGHETRALIENAEVVYVSVASVWEATIKYELGKLRLPSEPHPWLFRQREEHGFNSLMIDERTISHLSGLPAHHRDPFDRLLICQAIEHDLQLITADPILSKYPVHVLRPS